MDKSNASDIGYDPDVVLPPGDTLAEVLEERGMTQAELAARTGLSTKHINQIIKGAAAVTPESARLLERATGLPAKTWNNLEVTYRDFLSRQAEDVRLQADVGWLTDLPIKELAKR